MQSTSETMVLGRVRATQKMKLVFTIKVFVVLYFGALSGCAPGVVLYDPELEKEENETEPEIVQSGTIDANPYQETELDRALQRLVDDLELAVLGLSARDAKQENGPGGTHIVQPGEYLDLIIERTLPNSPIRENILRRAFVKLNPNAFGGNGNPNYLFARQKLRIPTVEDLRTIIFKSGELEELKSESREPSRGWIQYP